MSNITFVSDSTVKLIDSLANDKGVVQAARVSFDGEESIDAETNKGLIKFLIKNKHATPFEHNVFKFYVKTPIFVAREFMRHRTFSYNELSGRYAELEPEFYVPSEDRPLVQEGKPGAYHFVAGTKSQYQTVQCNLEDGYQDSWFRYRQILSQGIAKEVARDILPVGIMTQFYATCNARGLMNFLALRTAPTDHSVTPSYPLHEIAAVADKMEALAREQMPISFEAWDKAGRTSL